MKEETIIIMVKCKNINNTNYSIYHHNKTYVHKMQTNNYIKNYIQYFIFEKQKCEDNYDFIYIGRLFKQLGL